VPLNDLIAARDDDRIDKTPLGHRVHQFLEFLGLDAIGGIVGCRMEIGDFDAA
jgi:hypothetical protein